MIVCVYVNKTTEENYDPRAGPRVLLQAWCASEPVHSRQTLLNFLSSQININRTRRLWFQGCQPRCCSSLWTPQRIRIGNVGKCFLFQLRKGRENNKIEHLFPKKTDIIQRKKIRWEENLKVFLLLCSESLKTFFSSMLNCK